MSTPPPPRCAGGARPWLANTFEFSCALVGLVIAALLAGAPARAAPVLEPTFQTISDAQSLSDGVVTTLVEDQRGMIWAGTPAGLIRFDGYRFRLHAHDPGVPGSIGGNFVRSLLVARDGRLWVGTEADGLSVYDPQSELFSVYRHDPQNAQSIGSGAVTALAEDQDGSIWIGTRGGGLSRLLADGSLADRFTHDPADSTSLPDNRVQSLLVGPQGTLWLGSWNGLARKPRGSRAFEPVFSDAGTNDSLHDRAIWTLLLAADGRLWAGSQQGDIALIDRETGAGRLIAQTNDGVDAQATVYALAQQDADHIVVGRVSGVELRDARDGHLLQQFRHDPTRPFSLAGSDIRTLLHDRAGWLWVGGYGSGLQRYDPRNRSVQVRRHESGAGGVFAEPNVRSVLERRDGTLWVGTQERGIAIFNTDLELIDGFRIRPDAEHGLGGGRVMGIAELGNGSLWVGSDSGLYRYEPTTRQFHGRRVGEGRMRRLLAGAQDILWIATDDGLHRLRADGETLDRIDLDDGSRLSGDINALTQEPNGRLWVGGERGLYAIEPGDNALRPQRIDPEHDLAHSMVLGLLFDRRGVLWVDTPEGLHRLIDKHEGRLRFEQVSLRLGIADKPFGANLLEDARGRIWTHFFVYDPDAESVHELSRADGVDIGTGWFRAYAAGSDGRMYFGGSKGLLIVSPEQFDPRYYAPPVVATELKLDGIVAAAGALESGLTLQPDQRSLAIEFSALDYSDPDRNRYRYRLHGFDHDWIATDASYRVASYSNLWPGAYELEVQGSNRGGAFSPHVLRVPIRVQPAYWQTAWFLALALLGGSAVIWLGIRWRTARSEGRASNLQQVVEARTGELRRAKESAEAALAELTSAQRQLIASEKMASLGALVAGIAHEVNTPIGIAVTAASHLRDSSRTLAKKVEGGKLTRSDLNQWIEQADEAGDLVLSSLERAGHLIGSFKQVAVDQSSEQRRHFSLDVFLDEVKTSLHPIYRRTPYKLDVLCPQGIEMDSFPGALFQILTNLINNSLLHGFQGRESGTMRIRAKHSGAEVELEYSDDGVGMSEDIVARAFDPYFTTRRESGGSGLGLHLVQQLARDVLGGRLSLHSTPGEGCHFVFVLPRHAPSLGDLPTSSR